jgi:hypothetical protein
VQGHTVIPPIYASRAALIPRPGVPPACDFPPVFATDRERGRDLALRRRPSAARMMRTWWESATDSLLTDEKSTTPPVKYYRRTVRSTSRQSTKSQIKSVSISFVVGLRYTPFTTFRDARRRHGLIRRVTVP